MSYLDQILEKTAFRVSEEKRARSFNDHEREALDAGPTRGFEAAIRRPSMSLVAEIKRRSPSAGPIHPEADPAGIATEYEKGGARALSVLTEPDFFDGSLLDLEKARAATNLPVLRKDFLIDLYQVAQARAAGADAVLLITAALPDSGLLTEMAAAARQYGLDILIEVHDAFELDAAFSIEPTLLGVNQRDLTTFEVDAELALKLREEIPAEVAMIAESGINERSEVEALENARVDGILVGERLMRAGKPQDAVRMLLGLDQALDQTEQ